MEPSLATLKDHSRFLANWLEAHPEAAKDLAKSSFLKKPKSYEVYLKDAQKAVKAVVSNNIPQLKKIIREFRYRETARIAMRDLNNLAPFEEIGTELAHLAQALTEVTFHFLFQTLTAHYGIAKKELSYDHDFCCLGLGKLGGRDLNFSSDIDLIYFYREERSLKTKDDTLSTHEFFTKLGEQFNRTLMDKTEDGFVYRVDTELRPEGKKGGLTNTLNGMERYYESWGKEWERLAFTKARCVAGSQELADELLERLQPFIYRKYIDFSVLTQIRQLKNKINEEHIKSTQTLNVKLGVGGIREIEFIAGTLQIIYGGKLPTLQNHSTLATLKLLTTLDLIDSADEKILREAYQFLRRVENRLQMVADQQTHRLPKGLEALKILAQSMGYEDSVHFMTDLERHVHDVHQIFDELYGGRRKTKPSYLKELHERIINAVGYEDKFNELRIFKQDHEMELRRLDDEGSIALPDLWRHMTWIAEAVVHEAYNIVSRELEKKYGQPGKAKYAIIAMGKFGAEELTYQSDLDIICLYSEKGQTNGPTSVSNLEYFVKLTQWLISCLSVRTERGFAYKIDTELRPSGRSGALVTRVKSFQDYHKTKAQTWEKQALIKARPVGGDPDFIKQLEPLFWKTILDKTYDQESGEEIHTIRMRMEKELAGETDTKFNIKKGLGGIVDIEFITQYLQLRHCHEHYPLRIPQTLEALKRLESFDLLSAENSLTLQNSYIFYRRIESITRLLSEQPTDILRPNDKKLTQVASRLKLPSAEALIDLYRDHREKVRAIYLKIFES